MGPSGPVSKPSKPTPGSIGPAELLDVTVPAPKPKRDPNEIWAPEEVDDVVELDVDDGREAPKCVFPPVFGPFFLCSPPPAHRLPEPENSPPAISAPFPSPTNPSNPKPDPLNRPLNTRNPQNKPPKTPLLQL